MPKTKKASVKAPAKVKSPNALSALEKARQARKSVKDGLLQARVDKAVESLRVNPEIKRQLLYIQAQAKRNREPADLNLLSQRREELLRETERVTT